LLDQGRTTLSTGTEAVTTLVEAQVGPRRGMKNVVILLSFSYGILFSADCSLFVCLFGSLCKWFIIGLFRNMIRFYGKELLVLCPTPKLEDHPFSAVHDCLFNIFAKTLHIGGRASIRKLRTRHVD